LISSEKSRDNSVCSDVKQKRAANPHISTAENREKKSVKHLIKMGKINLKKIC